MYAKVVATHPAVPKLGMTAEVAKAMGVQSGKKCSTQ